MRVDELLALSADPATLLHAARDGTESIQVHEHAGLRWVYTGGESILSAFRPGDPSELVLPNHVAMLSALLFGETPRRLLNLGFGVGAFERFFADRMPDLEVVSVDTSASLVALAREWFQVPADRRVLIETAERYLRAAQDRFDIILCDIFSKQRHAACLFDAGFYADASRRLRHDGVLALNLSPATEQELLEILVAVRRSFPHVMLLTQAGHGNVVVLALRRPPPEGDRLRRRADECSRRLRVDLTPLPARLTTLPPPPGRPPSAS